MKNKGQIQTYLQQSLRNGKIIRWIDKCMPLTVYIAPFRFYSKQGEDLKYRQMVIRALQTWQNISGGKVTFEITTALNNSQINIDWKRVDRNALGYCNFSFDNYNRLFSADVQIGISDGVIHQGYMDENEVYHTILHEIGHSLGLGHSPYDKDIMYTPHKYGIINLSENDKATLRWMYKFDSGKSVDDIAKQYGYHTSNIDDIVHKLIEKNEPSDFEKVKSTLTTQNRDLLKEQENIADLKKYTISLQNINISTNVLNALIYKAKKPNEQ